jgi:NTE family protein
MITGTSMGAIIGAMYAQNPDAAAVIDRFRSYLKNADYEVLGLENIVPSDEDPLPMLQRFARTIAKRIHMSSMGSRPSLLKPDVLNNAIRYLLDDRSIEDTAIPFGAVATDLNSGESLLVRKGSIRRAVRWSALIPAFLPPEKHEGRLIADGAVTTPVPVDFTRAMGADVVVAVSVDPTVMASLEDQSIISIMQRCDLIRGIAMSRMQLEKADAVIHPDVADSHWSRFLEFERFVSAGVTEASSLAPRIRLILEKRARWLPRAFGMLRRGGN